VNYYPVPGNAILLSAATRVLAVEQFAAVSSQPILYATVAASVAAVSARNAVALPR
jgi:hypothetical protein